MGLVTTTMNIFGAVVDQEVLRPFVEDDFEEGLSLVPFDGAVVEGNVSLFRVRTHRTYHYILGCSLWATSVKRGSVTRHEHVQDTEACKAEVQAFLTKHGIEPTPTEMMFVQEIP